MDNAKRKPGSFASSAPARKLTDHDYSNSETENVINHNQESFVHINNSSPQNIPLENRHIGSLNWIFILKMGIMKVIYSKVSPNNKIKFNRQRFESELTKITKQSIAYGFYIMCYISFIYSICYLLTNSNNHFQFSIFDVSFTFISCQIFISLLVFIFKLWILNTET